MNISLNFIFILLEAFVKVQTKIYLASWNHV